MSRTRKLVTAFLLIALFSIGVSTQTVKANPEILVEIVPSTDTIPLLGEFYVNVTISNIEASHDLVGIEFQIKWNTTLIYATSMDLPSGHIFQEAEDDANLWVIRKNINHSNAPDTAWYLVTCSDLQAGYDAGYLPLTGSGVIAQIWFNSTNGEGNSTLYFKDLPPTDVKIKLSDGEGTQITDYTVVDSQIQVIPEFSSAILYVALLMFSLVTIFMHRRFSKKALR